jgi:cation diffusion facilitator CzcD-associated flavoprotein CzcO
MADADVIVVGAGPAGLACAATLKAAGHTTIVVEKAAAVASSWRRHYDRLHLHTPKSASALPGLPMPGDYPRYPSRDQVIAYLDAYAAHHGLAPHFGTEALRITRQASDWRVETGDGRLAAANVVVATGIAGWPNQPAWPGLETYTGRLIHSRDYANPAPFAGSHEALVVGFGNSGGEIALDLAEAGVPVLLSVRSPVNVVPRDLFGVPIFLVAFMQRRIPYRIADRLDAPVLRLALGNLRRLGLPHSAKGPFAQIAEDEKIPLLDIGTIGAIRDGRIKVRPGIARVDGGAVHFTDGSSATPDVIIAATGFRPDLRSLLPDHHDALRGDGLPLVCGRATAYPGLFFCGQRTVPGQLHYAGIQAQGIAAAIAGRA